MEVDNIQSRISNLEKHLEDVRKRIKCSLSKENQDSDKEVSSFSQESNQPEKKESESDSFSSSSEAPKLSNFNQFSSPQQGFYPMYYPQPDLRQQLDYLHFQLSQNTQVYMQNEKKWKEELQKIKIENNKLKEENTSLRETVKKLKSKEPDLSLKEKTEYLENLLKSSDSDKKKLEEKIAVLESENSKLKQKSKKQENQNKEEGYKNDIKKHNEKIAFLENKIESDKILIENLKKELSKSDDKIANLENNLIENRNNYSQINKKLSIENDSLKKMLSVQTRSKEIQDSDEVSKLKHQIYQKNKEIEILRAERSLEEEQPDPVEIKVNKRKNILNSERLASFKKQNRVAKEEEFSETTENLEEGKTDTLENQLIHLQIEKQKLENEYIKLPEFSRNLASKIRRAEVENELDSITKTIQCVKSKLKSLNLI